MSKSSDFYGESNGITRFAIKINLGTRFDQKPIRFYRGRNVTQCSPQNCHFSAKWRLSRRPFRQEEAREYLAVLVAQETPELQLPHAKGSQRVHFSAVWIRRCRAYKYLETRPDFASL